MNKYIKYLIESFFDDIEDDIIPLDNMDIIDTQIGKNAISKLSKYIDNTVYPDNIDNISFNKYELYTNITNRLCDYYIDNVYDPKMYENKISYNISLDDEDENGYDTICIYTNLSDRVGCYIKLWIQENIIKYIFFEKYFYKYMSESITLTEYFEIATMLYNEYNLTIENILVRSVTKHTERCPLLNINLMAHKEKYSNINPVLYHKTPNVCTIWNMYTDIATVKLSEHINDIDFPKINEYSLASYHTEFEENPTNLINICNYIKNNKLCKKILFQSASNKPISDTPAYKEFLKWSYDNKNYIYSISTKKSQDTLKTHLYQLILYKYLIPQEGEYTHTSYSIKFIKGANDDKVKYINVLMDFDGDLANSGKHVFHKIAFKFYLTGQIANITIK